MGVYVPPGQSAPFAAITPTDHRAWIIISSALGLCMSVLFAAIRAFVRSATKHGYGIDDYLLAAATSLASIQSIVLLSSCADGLGKSKHLLEQASLVSVQKKYYASNILFVGALALSKASVACFLMQLTPIQRQRRFIHILLGFVATWGVAFLFVMALVCDMSSPWILIERQYVGYFLRWQIMEIFGCLHEVGIFAIAVWLIWGLKTSPSNKAVVLVAFGFRLLMIVIVALRLGAFDNDGLFLDPTLRESQFISWTSAEVHYSLLSATIPILRPFMSNLSTNYGAGQGPGRSGYGQGSSGSYGHSALRSRDGNAGHSGIELKPTSRRLARFSQTLDSTKEEPSFHTADNLRVTNPLTSKDTDASSTGSNDSQKMIIRKDVTWQVQHDSKS